VATGFGVGGDRVVTVAHVLGGAVRVGGVPARVVRVDRRADLALLRVAGVAGAAPGESGDGEGAGGGEEADAGVGERAGDGEEAGAGDEVRVLRLRSGRSDSLSGRVRRAIVAHVRALGAPRAVTRPALALDARVVPGDSGAPVVSRSGALVGVVFATSARREGRAYAVDASAVRRLIARD
jgi:S1-C subfamily serine protease